MENDATATGERRVDIGLGTVVAVVVAVAAVRRRSLRLLVLALAAVGAEVVYRRWLAGSESDVARRIRT